MKTKLTIPLTRQQKCQQALVGFTILKLPPSVYLRPLTGRLSDYAGEFNWRQQNSCEACISRGPLLSRHVPKFTALTATEMSAYE